MVAGLSGEGTLSLGAGVLQSLSSAPLRGVAALAGKKTIKVDKEEIEAEAKGVREKITKGIYRYAPAKFAFEVKNGTLRLAPAALLSTGAETKINGYVELASLKLDSEWVDEPDRPGQQGRSSGQPALHRRAQQGGRDHPGDRHRCDRGLSHHAAHAGGRRAARDARCERHARRSLRTRRPRRPPRRCPSEPAEPLSDTAPMPEPEPLEQSSPTAATEPPNQAIPQSSPSAKASPSAIELLQEAWQTEPVIPAAPKPAEAMPTPPAESRGAETARGIRRGGGCAQRRPRRLRSPSQRPRHQPAPPAEAAVPPAAEPPRPPWKWSSRVRVR